MPRLLIVTTIPETFGFLLPFAEHFRQAGWSVDALTGAGREIAGKERFDRTFAVQWSRNPLDFRNLLLAPRRIREVVAERRPDVVHVHTPVGAFVTRLALRNRDRRRGPRVIYTAHGFYFHPGARPWRNAPFVALEKLAARWTDYLVVMNREDAAAARRLVPTERVWLMPGIGVDLRHYAPERVSSVEVREVRRALGVGNDPCFLMVAEFIRRKRHADVIHAFSRVAADVTLPRAHLLLAGAGPLMDEVRAATAELGLTDRVHFLGLRPDIPVLMRVATALVLPSDQEGLPRCILEAMSMGLPVVGTRIRGTAELLEGGCGALCEVGDAGGLATALRDVLVDPAAATVMARRARERVARYDVRNVIRLHEALYAEALGAGVAHAASG